jgi:hypothetical protein
MMISNEVINGNGGVLFIDFGANLLLESCNFSNSRASNLGGAIFVNFSFIVISDSMFSDNSASSGGAIYLNQALYVLISNRTKFIRNGAILKKLDSCDEIVGCGGAICANLWAFLN